MDLFHLDKRSESSDLSLFLQGYNDRIFELQDVLPSIKDVLTHGVVT